MSDIDQLRNKVDEVTIDMIKLLKKRTEYAKEIGTIKKNQGLNVTDEVREEQLRTKIIHLCEEIGLDYSLGTRFLSFLLNESVKVQSTNKQTHLSIFLKAKSLEEQGKKIIHMEVGEPDFFPPIIVKEALEQVYDKGFVKYGHAKGMTKFRIALAQYITKQFSVNITQDNILVCPGARFGVFLAITTLLNPGDEIIVMDPSWPAYKDCALNAGLKVRSIETTLENNLEPSIDQINERINPNTKMIVLNYPNNPTGKILPESLQSQIVEIARKNDLYILSDEIYSQYAYSDWRSILSYGYKKSIITQSFSKSHAMTGFRIGYVISESQIIEKMSKLQALCLTNVSEPIQYVALKALEADISDNTNTMKSKLNIVIKKTKELGLNFVEPDGAMYVFAKMKGDNFDATKLSNDLLDHGLAIAPGEGFGNYKNFIRISACQDEKTLFEGMNILDKYLKDLN